MRTYNRLVTAFAAVAAFATIAPLQAQDVKVIARVPFEFSVGNASLPRDTYRLSQLNGHPEMWLVRSDRKGVFVRTDPVRMRSADETPTLTFHRYGDQYFLREVRLDGRARLDLPETQAERDAAERRIDRMGAAMETVVIVAERR
jgi:hypothetical protein